MMIAYLVQQLHNLTKAITKLKQSHNKIFCQTKIMQQIPGAQAA
jgi:hypothetical protein